ncbi:aminopeptidase [Desulfonatronovibrio magnus]|uniref:aminopeptidase n=1 Tax=Desulfonatronovibrio magnus TaxID=698827 RepID=UPI0005EAFAD6|nr:aminopeptidase [Desulfonatronovibrio magnus]RQD65488.1 MAG: aminopeptidase [Desulfonatronovibrio sp. MSAO_Bac4]
MEFKTKNCWEVYKSKKHVSAMDRLAQDYIEFLSKCKTERETVEFLAEKAMNAGFERGISSDRFMKTHKGKSLILVRKGRKKLSEGLRILGAHADTPRLDLKQRPLYEECQVSLAKTHYYGGIRKHQWLARPLALHGVVIKTDGTKINVCIGEDQDDPVFTIADLLPHLAYKQVEKKLSEAFEAEKLNVVLGHVPVAPSKEKNEKEKNPVKLGVLGILNQRFGIIEEDLYSAELQAVPAGPARYVGLDKGLIGGYGHDDRVCTFAGFRAFVTQEDPEFTQLLIIWDKEEIGSEGSSGAKSLFMEYCIEDMLDAWEPETRIRTVFENSRALSADVHAAMDPDYQDVHEKLNASLLGHGPVFCKFTGHRGKVGANDAHPEYVAWLRGILNQAGIPWQMAETGKVDLGGGGTVAKFLAVYGMDIIDFGPGVLGMHSPFEICSKADLYASVLAFEQFFKS